MIIVTLTKLFEIRMVASKRSESSSKALMRESEGCSFSSTLLRSEGDNEKKAISDAETKPEAYNNRIARINANYSPHRRKRRSLRHINPVSRIYTSQGPRNKYLVKHQFSFSLFAASLYSGLKYLIQAIYQTYALLEKEHSALERQIIGSVSRLYRLCR